VTVSNNAATGIVVTDNAFATVVGGAVQASGSSNIFVGRGSGAAIGFGTNGLTGGVTIGNAGGNGISIEGGNATIVNSTISGSGQRGIVIGNGGSARVGVTNTNNVFGANTISGNTGDGIGLFHSASAYIGGNTIDGNGGVGVNVGGGSAVLVGGNTISNNGQTGVLASRGGNALIGDAGFGPPTIVNTISGNGAAGPNNGGIFAFADGNIQTNNATISNNVGTAVQAFDAGVIELRGTTTVTVPASGTTHGASVQLGSTLRLRDTASIVSATGDGIQATNLSAVNIRDADNVVQGNGPSGLGVNCFSSSPMTLPAVTLTGNLANVTGTAGGQANCNLFP
jgi:hypothetical protein